MKKSSIFFAMAFSIVSLLSSVVPAFAAETISWADLQVPDKKTGDFSCSQIPESIRDRLGRTVEIQGVIHAGSTYTVAGIKQFLLMKIQPMRFGPFSDASKYIYVRILSGDGIRFSSKEIDVTGRLILDDNWLSDSSRGWSYAIEDAAVK